MMQPGLFERTAAPARRLRVLDLCCGLGGFSLAFRERGHLVVGLDVQDLRTYRGRAGAFDVVLAAPPCDEFARESMPWCRTGKAPALDLVRAALRVVGEVRPAMWLLENVRGAVKYLDPLAPRHSHVGARFFWGDFPSFAVSGPPERAKDAVTGSTLHGRRLRSRVAYSVSLAVCLAAELAAEKKGAA